MRDEYQCWSRDAIVADLDPCPLPHHVAIEKSLEVPEAVRFLAEAAIQPPFQTRVRPFSPMSSTSTFSAASRSAGMNSAPL